MSNLTVGNINNSLANPFANNLAHFRQEFPAGTHGQSTSTGWNTIILNTEKINLISGASLSSNQITLPAGTYFVQGFCPSDVSDQSKPVLYNVSDSTYDIVGLNLQSYDTGGGASLHPLVGTLTFASTKVFELRFWAGNSGVVGWTTNTNVTPECYVDLLIWKIK
jgi:hypothetical protein